MPYTLERPERRGDRSRRKVSTPSEAVEKTYADGKVRVTCERSSTRDVLIRRHGFSEAVVEATPVAVEEAPLDLESLSHRERVKLAKSLGIKATYRMKSDELLSAIRNAQEQ